MITQSKIRVSDVNERNNPREVRGEHFPWSEDIVTRLKFLINYAVLAPSTHNTQPWLFRVSENTIDVVADRSRALPVIDPDDRSLVLSCGAATGNLLTALEALGFHYRLSLYPAPAEVDLISRIRITHTGTPSDNWEGVLNAIRNRKTVRAGYKAREIDITEINSIAQSFVVDSCKLSIASNPHRENAILVSVQQAEQMRGGDKHYVRENASWIHPMRRRSRDGVPMPHDRFQTLSEIWSPVDPDNGQKTSVVGAILSKRDRPIDWVESGMLLARVLNRATMSGLSAAIVNHPLHLTKIRSEIMKSLQTDLEPQVLVRIGYAEHTPSTPRRPLTDVMLHPGFSR